MIVSMYSVCTVWLCTYLYKYVSYSINTCFEREYFVDLWLGAFCVKYFADYKTNCNARQKFQS